MNTADKLKHAIAECEQANAAFIKAREKMRNAIKAHLSSFDERGQLIVIARKLNVSSSQIANLKHGYGVPSIEKAKAILLASQALL